MRTPALAPFHPKHASTKLRTHAHSTILMTQFSLFALLSSWWGGAHHAVPSAPPTLQRSLRLTGNTSLSGFCVLIHFFLSLVFSFLVNQIKSLHQTDKVGTFTQFRSKIKNLVPKVCRRSSLRANMRSH